MHRPSFFIVLAGIFLSAGNFFARATNANADWDNGAANNVFSNAVNWAGNTLPNTGYAGIGDFIQIDQAGANKCIYGSTFNNPGAGATSAQAGIFSRLQIADVSGNGELDVTNGYFDTDSTSSSIIGSSGRTGTLLVSGSTTTVNLGGWLFVGNSTAGTGVVSVVNGSFSSSRDNPVGGISHVSIVLGNGNGASGTLTLSGGSVATRSGVVLGGPGTTGTGRFAVLGGGTANVGTTGNAPYGFWVQNSGSTLAAYVTNGTLGQIYVANLADSIAGTYDDGNVIFMPGSKLELGFLGATNAGAWDLMKFDGALLTNGLSLVSGTDTNWSFAFVTNGSQTILRVIYISAKRSPPSGIVAYPGNEQATVRWSPLAGATNYFLQRATVSGGPYTVTHSLAGTLFTDAGLANGTTYYYAVRAAMTNGVTGNSFEVRATPYGGPFVHPGVVHTIADLERMRTNVLAKNYPWFMGYTNMLADFHSSSAYTMEGPLTTIYRDAITPTLPTAFQDDCGAAYQNALLWHLTGDPAHAAKAIQILDAWSSTCVSATGSDTRLACGLQGYKFITAAEIIRYTGAPWSQAEINTCSNFVRTVLLPQNRMYGGGNWGQIGACSAMAAGVFMNDEAVFNEALNAIKYGTPTECDMGTVTYINPLGWTDESDRDIGHWGLALDNLTAASAIAWCQGLDLWTFLNNRLLTAHEYLAYFNANNNSGGGLSGLTNVLAAYVAGSQCDGPANGALISQTANAINDLGAWYPLWEQALNPYQNLIGLSALWTSNAVAQERPEGYDRDHIAFGTLVAALPPRTPGLPLLPSGLAATWSNAQVNLIWNSASNATSYFVKRAISRGGPYTDMANDITATNFTDATVSNDMLYFYKISAANAVGETADSGLATAYPSAGAPAAPTGLAAKTTSDARIDLSWNAVPGATSYSIKRAANSGGPYTGLANGALYYYVVSGTNYFGEGTNSAAAAVRPVSSVPPRLNFAFTANQMQFNWPTDHIGWQLQAQTNPLSSGLGTNWATISDSGNTNQIAWPVITTNGSVFYRLTHP